ncbi:MAG: sigma-70 family RNA polymerase sigma factor [Clostridia bacterium]|nr:sigma-70 family RNA polymerase sigma factor [Clostridia bacterium]
MQYGKVVICGVDTSTLPILNEAQKNELLRKTRDGESWARDKLINGNLRLVLSVIKRFQGRGENPDDLFQIGCIGLIKAIDNFDITQNVRFSTYAVPMVIECRNPRKDFESYDQKNRIITGNFATLRGPKEYRDLRETQRHFRRYAADQLD